ncbi:MAG TPA: GxxExxY protein [Anaerolineales bacterium]|nr:GxxExxY protein [Anaerolineales bacterium]HUM25537.1 GxxExxY protein [Anaerolineales bacterium]
MPNTPTSPLSPEDERIARLIVDSAYTIHKTLGAGLLESVYETCLCHELGKRGLSYKRQVTVPLVYDGIKFTEGFRIDILVEERIICELKSVERMENVHLSQVLTYLKLTGNRLGFLINFNVSLIKNGIRRIIL